MSDCWKPEADEDALVPQRSEFNAEVEDSAFTENMIHRMKMCALLDTIWSLLDCFEDETKGGIGWAGRLSGMIIAVNILRGWPSAEVRYKVMTRAKPYMDEAADMEEAMAAMWNAQAELSGSQTDDKERAS